MVLEQKGIKKLTLTCDVCKKLETFILAENMPNDFLNIPNDFFKWILFKESDSKGLRLFEALTRFGKYESFHVPNKRIVCFCCENCALQYVGKSAKVFIQELVNLIDSSIIKHYFS